MPMTTAAGSGGCWTLRIDCNEAHWQDWDLGEEGNMVMDERGHTCPSGWPQIGLSKGGKVWPVRGVSRSHTIDG